MNWLAAKIPFRICLMIDIRFHGRIPKNAEAVTAETVKASRPVSEERGGYFICKYKEKRLKSFS
ncbi:hypothetical protein L0337_13335 [candidate division KSB1 bacterium]|nr:hypothetical protein [candidate division KSB1 bacterium]